MNSAGRNGGIYRPLSDNDVEKIHRRSLDLLEQIGMSYGPDLDDMIEMLEGAGCTIDREESRIYFPPELVEESVSKASSQLVLYSRDAKNDLLLGGDRVYCGTGGTAVRILDLDTGEPRQSVVRDLYNVARLTDRLDNIHFYQHCATAHDIPTTAYDINALFAGLMGTTKHVMFGCTSVQGLRDALELASLVAGGRDKLREKPIFSISTCMIISPLKFCSQSTKNVMEAARQWHPTTVTSAPMSGSTAPMTMAGTILQIHAEELAGITVHQLTNPGAPVMYGGLAAMADMASMGYQGGGVGCGIMNAAVHQMSKHIGVPNYSSSALSDAKVPDQQAGWEKAFTTALNVMGGSNYIHHAAGMLESMLCIAYEQYVMDDEIIGAACKILEGINLDEDHLAFEAIGEVGPGGNFLMSDHTARHLRSEYFLGNGVSDRGGRITWEENGKLTVRQRAREKARKILNAPDDPKIPTDIQKIIREKFDVFL